MAADVALEELSFAGHGGDAVRALFVRPAGGAAEAEPRPGVVLVHEVFGVDAHARSVAERFAREGYAVLLPDLYSREGVPGPASTPDDPAPEWSPETIAGAVASLPDRRALGDLDAAAEALGERRGVDSRSLAAVGFCMGGTLAFQLGCTSTRVACVVDFYGGPLHSELSEAKPTQPIELVLNLDRPFLGLFAGEDPYVPADDVELLRERLTQAAKDFEVVVYPGVSHGFFNDDRPHHDARAAEDAWRRTLAFLRDHL